MSQTVEPNSQAGKAPLTPSPARPTAPAAGPAGAQAPAALVRGESLYDQISSMLMAVVMGALLVVGWLALIYYTNQAYASRVTAPIEIIEVFGGGGGSPEGTPGSTESVNVPGAEAAPFASNNEEDASEFEQPSLQESPDVVLDSAAEAGGAMAEVDVGAPVSGGGAVARGKRASKIGTGGPGLGFGPGDGGVSREQRWSIIYPPNQTADEYARQLDYFGVELATITGNQMTYISHFSQPTPTVRTGSGAGDKRLYFLWQGGARKAADVALFRKAGIDVGNKPIFQFYAPGVEQTLAQLEVKFKGRQPGEIRSTKFSVVPQGNGYRFVVMAQDPLR
jgi:hypothetical protein